MIAPDKLVIHRSDHYTELITLSSIHACKLYRLSRLHRSRLHNRTYTSFVPPASPTAERSAVHNSEL